MSWKVNISIFTLGVNCRMKILPCITTTNYDITEIQIQQASKYKQKEYALFITGINDPEERINFLHNLKKHLVGIEFPFAHIRIDSTKEELLFCEENFGTEWFNIHCSHANLFKNSDIYKYKYKILAENSKTLNDHELNHFAGICLDLAHYFEDKINDELYIDDIENAINSYPIVCNHVSAIRFGTQVYAEHVGNKLSDFDYLKKIPKQLFGTNYVCLELENTIETQFRIINYIESII